MLGASFSFQTGADGVSLAVAAALRSVMLRLGVQGSLAAGGVTGQLCDVLEERLFRTIFDVQCFDLRAINLQRRDSRHMAMSSVNVTTGSSGRVVADVEYRDGTVIDVVRTVV